MVAASRSLEIDRVLNLQRIMRNSREFASSRSEKYE